MCMYLIFSLISFKDNCVTVFLKEPVLKHSKTKLKYIKQNTYAWQKNQRTEKYWLWASYFKWNYASPTYSLVQAEFIYFRVSSLGKNNPK